MSTPDVFQTLAASSAAEPPKTKGSRFLGEAVPVGPEAAWRERLAEVRRREHAATHHVWAVRLGAEGQGRSSDDGEPSGSAGVPVLREIEGRGLTDVLVVVTRYYGGTKLGVGGLMRAYAEAAGAALDAGRVREVVVRVPVRLRFAFADTSPAMRLLDVFDAVVAGQTHTASGTELNLQVRRSEADALRAAFVEATAGRGEVVEAGP
ncbi:MAG: YigZ family protein [Bacteroidota bacterium]